MENGQSMVSITVYHSNMLIFHSYVFVAKGQHALYVWDSISPTMVYMNICIYIYIVYMYIMILHLFLHHLHFDS